MDGSIERRKIIVRKVAGAGLHLVPMIFKNRDRILRKVGAGALGHEIPEAAKILHDAVCRGGSNLCGAPEEIRTPDPQIRSLVP
jgi:hypothetical protein